MRSNAHSYILRCLQCKVNVRSVRMAAAASSSSPSSVDANMKVFVWRRPVPSVEMPQDFGEVASKRWLLQVVYLQRGSLSANIAQGVLKKHRSDGFRDWPQILLLVGAEEEDHAETWNDLHLSFDTLVVAKFISQEEFLAFSPLDLQLLVDRFETTREQAVKLEAALSQKEMIVAASSVMNKISSVKHMINDMINNVTEDSEYFMGGDALVSVSERRTTVFLDMPVEFPAIQKHWHSLLGRMQNISSGSREASDVVVRFWMIEKNDFTLGQYRPKEVGFVYHVLLVARSLDSSRPAISDSLYERINRESFNLHLHYEVISCVPSTANLQSAIECALLNAKDCFDANSLMGGVDTSVPGDVAEADVDRAIDESVATIKQAKKRN